MSLFGALFSGVSGLGAQGTAMGVIGDNITNVSTVGYKTTATRFKTLVTVAASTTSYAPGGVAAAPQQLLDRQGLLQSSVSPTDLAINGDGFFVVNELSTPSSTQGSYLYTRAGSFTKDEDGNLVNAGGFFLQGWPIDSNGDIPSNRSDLTELETVNIDGLAGTAEKTSSVGIQANLKASQSVTVSLPNKATLSGLNVASTAVLGNAGGTGTVTGLADGDVFTIASSVGSISQTFTYQTTPTASSFQFSTLQELADLVNSVDGLRATVGGSSSAATVTISGPPDGTLTLTDTTNTPGTDLFGAGEVGGGNAETATYAAGTSATNMASTNITPDFERSVAVFDSKGGSHTLTFGFLKSTLANTWLTEVYIEPSSETTGLTNGIVASGTLAFNTDGSIDLASTTSALKNSISLPWAPALGVASQSITVDWGTDDATDGFTQFDSDSALVSTTVDGAIFGELANITVTELGVVTAVFENGVTRSIYKLPVATFSNTAGLKARTGNAYQETDLSGQFSLNEASVGGSGLVAPSTLEASTVDLAEEFAKMIISQRAFSAATRIITTSDDMLDELIRIKR
jgi:flagellar hook protein FlgE